MSHQHLLGIPPPPPTLLCSPAGASRHPALHGAECEEEGGSDAVPAGAALQQRGQNVTNCNGNTSSSLCLFFFLFTSLQIITPNHKSASPHPAGGRNYLHGHQASHFHPPALRFLHRGRSVADQPAHLFGAAALRQALRPGGRPPAAAAHRAKSRGQVRLQNTLCTIMSSRGHIENKICFGFFY